MKSKKRQENKLPMKVNFKRKNFLLKNLNASSFTADDEVATATRKKSQVNSTENLQNCDIHIQGGDGVYGRSPFLIVNYE